MADQPHMEHGPMGLPAGQDEAPDTPMWVPALGIALVALFGLMIAYRSATAGADVEAAQVAEPAAEAPSGTTEAPSPTAH